MPGRDDIASFFERVMAEDSERAHQCHKFLTDLGRNGQHRAGVPAQQLRHGLPGRLNGPAHPAQLVGAVRSCAA